MKYDFTDNIYYTSSGSATGGSYRGRGARPKFQHIRYGHGDRKPKCYACGYVGHTVKDPMCPARGQTCRKCSGKDHFATVCKSKSRVNQIDTPGDIRDGAFGTFSINTDPVMVNVAIGGISLDVLADTGSSRNVIDNKTYGIC